LNRKTIQNWRTTGILDKRKGSARLVPHKFSEAEEQAFYDAVMTKRFADRTPEQIVATLAEEGLYYGRPSTLYRILRKRNLLKHRASTKKPVRSNKAVSISVTASNQVWAWDITWLKTDVAGLFKYAYTIIDLYDRSIVGWAIEDCESDEHARKLFERVIRAINVIPQFIHADNGGPMRGVSLAVFLDSLCITRSYSRPRCSNDNAFIESWHKTLKYTPGYPGYFTSLEHARTWYADFVNWYNHEHQHSALAYVTPYQRRTGEAIAIYQKRNHTMLMAKQKHLNRWKTGNVHLYTATNANIVARPIQKYS
jgi:transposase InsO family protein